jgi:predicted RNA polymerase sigma factor
MQAGRPMEAKANLEKALKLSNLSAERELLQKKIERCIQTAK